jgi:hypothetical protein
MLATALIIVAAIVVVFLAAVALQPADFRIQRTALIAAFMAKAVSMFMSMEKMVGGQFEKGLAQMKSVVETKR